jgi:hypothetical protein
VVIGKHGVAAMNQLAIKDEKSKKVPQGEAGRSIAEYVIIVFVIGISVIGLAIVFWNQIITFF